jgi:hypothetical protein
MDGGAKLRHPFLPSSPTPAGAGQRTTDDAKTLKPDCRTIPAQTPKAV